MIEVDYIVGQKHFRNKYCTLFVSAFVFYLSIIEYLVKEQ